MDEKIFRVDRADFKVAKNPAVLETIGLGSCVGIVLYDQVQKIGGLAHIMLPYQADSAIEAMLENMLCAGAKEKNTQAMLFGGADMFPEIKKKMAAIGEKNLVAVKEDLEKRKIKIIAEETGGVKGRTLRFNLKVGSVEVKYATREKKVYFWRP